MMNEVGTGSTCISIGKIANSHTHAPVQSADASFQYDEVLLRAVHVYVFVPAKPDPHMREPVCADEHVAPTEAALQAIRPAQSARIGHCGVAVR